MPRHTRNPKQWFNAGNNVHEKINARSNAVRSILGRSLPDPIPYDFKHYMNHPSAVRYNDPCPCCYINDIKFTSAYYVHQRWFASESPRFHPYIHKDALFHNSKPANSEDFVRVISYGEGIPDPHHFSYDARYVRNFQPKQMDDTIRGNYIAIMSGIRVHGGNILWVF